MSIDFITRMLLRMGVVGDYEARRDLPPPPTMPRTDSTLARDAPDVRVVGCDACGTEGRIYLPDSGGYWGERGTAPCPYCDGTGGEVIAVWPIEMDDLEDVGC